LVVALNVCTVSKGTANFRMTMPEPPAPFVPLSAPPPPPPVFAVPFVAVPVLTAAFPPPPLPPVPKVTPALSPRLPPPPPA
jgi:hypothetical protein